METEHQPLNPEEQLSEAVKMELHEDLAQARFEALKLREQLLAKVEQIRMLQDQLEILDSAQIQPQAQETEEESVTAESKFTSTLKRIAEDLYQKFLAFQQQYGKELVYAKTVAMGAAAIELRSGNLDVTRFAANLGLNLGIGLSGSTLERVIDWIKYKSRHAKA